MTETLDLPFFNTIELTGAELARAHAKARSQEDKILVLFRAQPRGTALTPEDLLPFMKSGTPITSVRRAMTNLANVGKLEKISLTERFTRGRLGKPVHSWRLR